jgi:hypothetical protein
MTRESCRIIQPLWALLVCGSGGCVTVYQPLVGLQNPVAIEQRADNFKGLRLKINCLSGDYVDREDAQTLCRNTAKLLTNQGAIVRTGTTLGASSDEDFGSRKSVRQGRASDVDLEIDLSARSLHEDNSALMWVISLGTLTLIPQISESTFAQDVSIRDANGFLLATENWQARFVRYFGVAIWAVNALLDLTLRKPAEKLTGDAQAQDFSRDFYLQLTQLVFNAKSRWAVLNSNEGP